MSPEYLLWTIDLGSHLESDPRGILVRYILFFSPPSATRTTHFNLPFKNEPLESAFFGVIANLALVGITQWEQALRLFRARSFDSLVRYFVSNVPDT